MTTQKNTSISVGVSWIMTKKGHVFPVTKVSDITKDVTRLHKACRMECFPWEALAMSTGLSIVPVLTVSVMTHLE